MYLKKIISSLVKELTREKTEAGKSGGGGVRKTSMSSTDKSSSLVVRDGFFTSHMHFRCGENFSLLCLETPTSLQHTSIVHTSRKSTSEIRENLVSIDNSLYYEIILLVSTEVVNCSVWWRLNSYMGAVQ